MRRPSSLTSSPLTLPLLCVALLAMLSSCTWISPFHPADADADGFTPEQGDCNDEDPLINPWANDDPHNGVDEDCNGNDAVTCYLDADQDGFGGAQAQMLIAASGSCEDEAGLSSNDSDCADNNAAINRDAEEVCDGLDNDCDDQIDEDIADSALILGYPDLDGDGDGDADVAEPIRVCASNTAFALTNTDCDDQEPRTYGTGPNGLPHPEVCDGIENDCLGSMLIGEDVDVDGDGAPACGDNPCPSCTCIAGGPWDSEFCGDCDDTNETIFPGAPELCDDIDNNCDGQTDESEDRDGDGWRNCDPDTGLSEDCDDDNPHINPSAVESMSNCIDDDCDGQIESADEDGDGYTQCSGDCDDQQSSTNPGQLLDPCNGVDDDCDGIEDEDAQILVLGTDAQMSADLRDFLADQTTNGGGGYCTASMQLDQLSQGTDLSGFSLIILNPSASNHEGSTFWPGPPNAFTDIVVDSFLNYSSGAQRAIPSILTMGYTGKALYGQLAGFQNGYDWDEDGDPNNGLVGTDSVQLTLDIGSSYVQCQPDQSLCTEGLGAQQGRPVDDTANGCAYFDRLMQTHPFSDPFYEQPSQLPMIGDFTFIIDDTHPYSARAYPLWRSALDSSQRLQEIGAPGCSPEDAESCWGTCDSAPRALIVRERLSFTLGVSSSPSAPSDPVAGEPWLYYWGFDAPTSAWAAGGKLMFSNIVYWAVGCPGLNPNCTNDSP